MLCIISYSLSDPAFVDPLPKAATTSAGMCVPDDLLAVVDGAVVLVGAGPEWGARSLVGRLAGGVALRAAGGFALDEHQVFEASGTH